MTFLGIDWGDVGKGAMGGLHVAGRTLASAFGGSAGANLADQSEGLQKRGGLLPDWARSDGGGPKPVTVSLPEAFVLVRKSGAIEQPITGAASVTVTGGSRVDGDGRFSVAFDEPTRVDVTMKTGQKASGTDIRQIIFKGGTEAATSVKGDDMESIEAVGEQIIGELVDEGEETFSIEPNIYVHGADVLGALSGPQTSRAGFVIRKTARGREFTALATAPRKGDLHASVQNAIDVGRRAIQVSRRITATLNRLPTHVKGIAPERQVKRAITVQEMKKLASQLASAGQSLLAKSGKLDKSVKTADAKVKAGTMAVRTKMGITAAKRAGRILATMPGAASAAARTARTLTAARVSPARRATVMGAAGYEILGAAGYDVLGECEMLNTQMEQAYEILGEELCAIHYEVLGDAQDEAAQAALEAKMYAAAGPRDGESGASVPSSGTSVSPSPQSPASYSTPPAGEPLPGPAANYGMGPPPKTAPPRPVPYMTTPPPESDRTLYDSSKMSLEGIVPYEGERGLPRDRFGSYERYFGASRSLPHGGNGYYWAADITVDGQGWARRDLNGVGGYEDHGVPVEYLMMYPTGVQQPGGGVADWGPLVGSPDGWTKGLRFDVATKTWFWPWDEAPDWASGKVAYNLQLLHQAQVDYDAALTAAKTDFLLQQAQDKLDAQQSRELARQQALDDANMARHQQELDMQQARADQQATEAQGKLEQQQAASEQRWAEQQQSAEQRWSDQQQDLAAREQGAMMSYMEQRPEMLFQQQQQGGGFGGGEDEGGGEGGADFGQPEMDWGDGTAQEGEQAATEMLFEQDAG